MSDPAVDVRGLERRYGAREVLRGLDLRIEAGEIVALLGSSGGGKSTLLRVLGGLDHGDGGTVAVRARTAIVFQEPRLLPWQRVWRNVVIGLPRDRDRALAALAEVGLADRADDWPRMLSGGQAQRVALARALVRRPGLLLLDEPFAAVDALQRMRLHDLVLELWREHRPATLLVTHDVGEAIALADRMLVLRDGVLAVDVPVRAPRPRHPDDTELETLRVRLLAELGVLPPAHDARPSISQPPTRSLTA